MIRVHVFRDGSGEITGFCVTGHAGLAESGNDVVCAAVSALTQTAVLGLKEVARVNPKVDIAPGSLCCERFRTTPSARIILETMVVGLKNIEQGYSSYLLVEDKEV
ncbi:MAG: ribosomal-processing cysteine protease Prp [Bacillota bacterium]